MLALGPRWVGATSCCTWLAGPVDWAKGHLPRGYWLTQVAAFVWKWNAAYRNFILWTLQAISQSSVSSVDTTTKHISCKIRMTTHSGLYDESEPLNLASCQTTTSIHAYISGFISIYLKSYIKKYTLYTVVMNVKFSCRAPCVYIMNLYMCVVQINLLF